MARRRAREREMCCWQQKGVVRRVGVRCPFMLHGKGTFADPQSARVATSGCAVALATAALATKRGLSGWLALRLEQECYRVSQGVVTEL